MKTFIEILNTVYYTSKETGKVTCMIECRFTLQDKLYHYPAYFANKKKFPKIKHTGYFSVVGWAQCNERDTFDETTGKRIAESKAKKKLYKIGKNYYRHMLSKMREDIALIERAILANEINFSKENTHLITLTC